MRDIGGVFALIASGCFMTAVADHKLIGVAALYASAIQAAVIAVPERHALIPELAEARRRYSVRERRVYGVLVSVGLVFMIVALLLALTAGKLG